MIRLIIKNLWARRRRNVWLLGELILVSVLTWNIIDPIVVITYNRSLPLGYDPDGLYILDMSILPQGAPEYKKEEADSAQMMNRFFHLLDEVRRYPDVQSATPIVSAAYPNSLGRYIARYIHDTLTIEVRELYFLPNSSFFETYGMQGMEGKTAWQLDEHIYDSQDIICTRSALKKMFPEGGITGEKICMDTQNDSIYLRVAGVVEDQRYYFFEQPYPLFFKAVKSVDDFSDLKIVLRLKEGVSEGYFLHEFRSFMNDRLRAGNLSVHHITSYNDFITAMDYRFGMTNKYRTNLIMCLFFLINLILGVTGSFWLQTKSRRGDIGIMLSYGAGTSRILRMLLGEGVVMATVGAFIGCIIFLHYGLSEGLCKIGMISGDYWINHFILHFLAVSAIVYVIVLVAVLLGVYIPARKISRIDPTDALHDE